MMMLTSQPISAEKGVQAGLIDAVVPPGELLSRARAIACDIANLRIARKVTIDYTAQLESLAEAEAIFKFCREEATKRAGMCGFTPCRFEPPPFVSAVLQKHCGHHMTPDSGGVTAEAAPVNTAARCPLRHQPGGCHIPCSQNQHPITDTSSTELNHTQQRLCHGSKVLKSNHLTISITPP